MEKLYGAGDIMARYGVSREKAKEMLGKMNSVNIGTGKRRILMVTESNLAIWERENTRVHSEKPAKRRKRPAVVLLNEWTNPDGTCKRRTV